MCHPTWRSPFEDMEYHQRWQNVENRPTLAFFFSESCLTPQGLKASPNRVFFSTLMFSGMFSIILYIKLCGRSNVPWHCLYFHLQLPHKLESARARVWLIDSNIEQQHPGNRIQVLRLLGGKCFQAGRERRAPVEVRWLKGRFVVWFSAKKAEKWLLFFCGHSVLAALFSLHVSRCAFTHPAGTNVYHILRNVACCPQ